MPFQHTHPTIAEKLLLAAAAMEQDAPAPFLFESLVVRAWELFPTAFGLKGYGSRCPNSNGYADKYPNSNVVSVSLASADGPVRRGWLKRTGPKQYAVTDAGRRVLKRLQEQVQGEELAK